MSITTEQIWHDFHAPLLQFIRTRVAGDSNAEDIVQEVFLKIHRQIENALLRQQLFILHRQVK